jgi:hypothetical protein
MGDERVQTKGYAFQERDPGRPPQQTAAGPNESGMGTKKAPGLKQRALQALEKFLDVLHKRRAGEEVVIDDQAWTERVQAITEELKTEKEANPQEAATLKLERRLANIERLIAKQGRPIVPTAAKGGRPQEMSWAQRAAMPPPQRQAGTQHVVNVRVEQSGEESPEALLLRIKTQIPAATALRNIGGKGKVAVIVKSAKDRDEILKAGTKAGTGITVMKRVYQVLVMGVPIKTNIGKEGSPENRILIDSIERWNAKKGWKVVAARWLYTEKQLADMQKDPARKKGTMILTVGTEKDQREVIMDGVRVGAFSLDTSLWDMAAEDMRCFKCQEWGHMQKYCEHEETCGHCGGCHHTRDCISKEPEQASCSNCKQKGHKAWWTRACPKYKTYRAKLMQGRNLLVQRTWSMRAETPRTQETNEGPAETLAELTAPHQAQAATQKEKRNEDRGVDEATTGMPKKRGRPTAAATLTATIAPGQQTLSFAGRATRSAVTLPSQ